MIAFDRAWDVAKMPYHGTTEESARKIMIDGLKPYFSQFLSGNLPFEGRWGWATDSLDEAREYAKNIKEGEKGAVIHISDDIKPHQKLRRSITGNRLFPPGSKAKVTSGGYLHSMYDRIVPPEYLRIVHEGDLG
jgi:hypothetical protein